MEIWTDNPQALSVTHDDNLVSEEPAVFWVEVSSGDEPVGSAVVCLWKEGDIYEVEETNAAGQVTFSIAPELAGTMYVTVSKHNYLPYEGELEVTEAGGCVGDLDEDSDTDQSDLGILLADWGCDGSGGPCDGDCDGDGDTDQADLGILLAALQAGTGEGDLDGDGDTDQADLGIVLADLGCPM